MINILFNKKEYRKKWREEHKEELNDYIKKWRKDNPEKSSIIHKKYVAKHRNYFAEKSARYRKKMDEKELKDYIKNSPNKDIYNKVFDLNKN